jgi:hypothetical protein
MIRSCQNITPEKKDLEKYHTAFILNNNHITPNDEELSKYHTQHQLTFEISHATLLLFFCITPNKHNW